MELPCALFPYSDAELVTKHGGLWFSRPSSRYRLRRSLWLQEFSPERIIQAGIAEVEALRQKALRYDTLAGTEGIG
jgi:hypothetical protein